MGLFGKGNKHQKRGQPDNAGQFAKDTRGAIAPETGGPSAATQPATQSDITETSVADTNQQFITFRQLINQKEQHQRRARREEEKQHARDAVDRYLDNSTRSSDAEGELVEIKRLPDGSHAALIYMVDPDNPRDYAPTSRTVFYDLGIPTPRGGTIVPDETGGEIPFDYKFPDAVANKYGPHTLVANVYYNDRNELTVAQPAAPGSDLPRVSNTHPGSLIILPGELVREHGAAGAHRIAQNEATVYQSYP
jgi:hypothetical protein